MKKVWEICLGFMGILTGACAGGYGIGKIADKALKEQEKRTRRAESYYEVLNQWLVLKNEGKNLEQFFEENNYKKIAIYGFADIGQRLYEELKGSDKLEIAYIIDKNADGICAETEVFAPVSELPKVDAIVVTPTFAYNEIEKMLNELIPYPVLSIEDVVYDI